MLKMTMNILSAQFVASNTELDRCPKPEKPEFAFIGRSNVGKSSLINLITNRRSLAKTSGQPGKTKTINHFLINDAWYLVDLPGYGYANTSRHIYKGWGKMIENYLLKRESLYCTFVLIDCRHELQPADGAFLTWLGKRKIPLAIVMTKTDKLSKQKLSHARECLHQALYKDWQELPPIFTTSAKKKTGREDVYKFIDKAVKN